MIDDSVALSLSHGYDAGNSAAAYLSEDINVALRRLDIRPDGSEPSHAYYGAFVLGFYSSFERHEIPMRRRETFDDAMTTYAPMLREIGIAVRE